MIYKFLNLIFIISITFAQDVTPNSDLVSKDSLKLGPIVFKTNLTKCPMYTDCSLYLLAKKVLNLNKDSFFSTSESVFTIDNVNYCENDVNCAEFEDFNLDSDVKNEYSIYEIKLKSVVFGGAHLKLINEKFDTDIDHQVIITEPRRIIDKIFDVYVWVFQVVVSILMGCLLDYEILKKIIKMPYPVLIGLSSQYVLMPILAFTFVSLFHLKPAEALALFIYGCCPGGAASNNWTILFDGDIDLSAIMTFMSTLAAFIAMPAWVYTLGYKLSERANIQLPYLMLFVNIFITVGPCLIGFGLSHYLPKVKDFATKTAKPFTLVFLITFFMLVIGTKFYVFQVMKWYHLIAGPLIPWAGYIAGGVGSAIFCLPFKQVKTISIETGLQNVGVAFLVVMTNFPSPDKEIAYLPLISVATLTIIPLYIVYGITKAFKGIKYLINKLKKTNNNNDDTNGKELQPEETKMIPNDV